MLENWSFYAGLLFFTSCVAAGVVSAVVATWRMRLDVLELKEHVALIAGIQEREVKVRAGQARQAQPKPDPALAELLAAPKEATPARRYNWWEKGAKA